MNRFKLRCVILWLRLIRKLRPTKELMAFRKNGSGIKTALIIFPEGQENSRIARYFLKSVYANKEVDLHFLMDIHLYHSFMGTLPTSVHIYTDEDISWFGLPQPEFVNRVCSGKYHAVVDMHPSFNLVTAYLTYLSKAPIRVGFFGEFSQHFFNVEIDKKGSQFIEKSYLSIQKLLNL